MVHPHEIAGEICWLVQPTFIGAKWTKHNLIFRSSVWNSKGELISASFPKFHNWHEQPDLNPAPQNLNGVEFVEKLDGSTLCISRYRGQLIVRTRGTVDASKIDNGHEIEILKKKYPNAFISHDEFGHVDESETISYTNIFEWTTPSNQIVLSHDEPEIHLIGCISHENYEMASQELLDHIAKALGLKRPKRYNFDSIENMLSTVEAFKGVEGVCAYYNKGQNIRKIKAIEYLAAHRLKSEIGSIDKVIDLYFALGRPSYEAFEKYINSKFDFEIFSLCRGHVSKICDGMKEVEKIVSYMKEFVAPLAHVPRKDAAEKILQAYGNTNRSGFAFSLLSGKTLKDDDYKKLLYQCLKE